MTPISTPGHEVETPKQQALDNVAANIDVQPIGFRYGVITGALMIGYFLIMRSINLVQITEFRFLNYVIEIIGISLALAEVRRRAHRSRIKYLHGLGVGLYTALTAAIIFGVFVYIYSEVLDRYFMDQVLPYIPFGEYLNSGMLGFLGFAETVALGVVITFVMMQFLKRNEGGNTDQEDKEMEGGLLPGIAPTTPKVKNYGMTADLP